MLYQWNNKDQDKDDEDNDDDEDDSDDYHLENALHIKVY